MKKLVPALLLLVFAAACTKDENISMRTRMITDGAWRLSDLRAAGTIRTTSGKDSTVLDTSLISVYPDYFRDNRYRFLPGGNLVTLEGQKKRLPQVPDSSVTGRWAFSLADTKITLSDSISTTYDVMQLTDSQMVFQIKRTEENGSTGTSTSIYRR